MSIILLFFGCSPKFTEYNDSGFGGSSVIKCINPEKISNLEPSKTKKINELTTTDTVIQKLKVVEFITQTNISEKTVKNFSNKHPLFPKKQFKKHAQNIQ